MTSTPPPTFTTFTHIATELASYHASQLDSQHRQLEETRKRLAIDMDVLERRTNHFIHHHWADLREHHWMPIRPYSGGWGRSRWDWQQYFRNLARDLHYPFIHVRNGGRYVHSTNIYQTRVLLEMPRRKYLLPLYSSFLLLDQSKHFHNTVSWCWSLEPEMFVWWCEQLKTDEEMRNALTHSTRNHR